MCKCTDIFLASFLCHVNMPQMLDAPIDGGDGPPPHPPPTASRVSKLSLNNRHAYRRQRQMNTPANTCLCRAREGTPGDFGFVCGMASGDDRHLFPWNHLPWPQIIALQLPMSLIQESDSAGSFSPLSFPLFWALNHHPWNRRVGDGGSLLCGRCLFIRSDNQPNAVVGSWSVLERRRDGG